MEDVQIVTQHQALINGAELPYEAVVENFIFADSTGRQEAAVYTHSYIRKAEADPGRRPVLFAYNGGPGCSSIYIHMGMLGPKRLNMGDMAQLEDPGRVELEDNPDCPLDVCDVVIIDAVGTGYSRLLAEDRAEAYYTSMADASVTAAVIRRWLLRHGRWASPVYLAGESYATIRNVLAAQALAEDPFTGQTYGLHPAGIVMLGTASDFGQARFPVPMEVLDLPTLAAVNWYQNRLPGALEDFVEEAYRYSCDTYARALFMGRRLSPREREEIAGQLSRFTGFDAPWILDSDLVLRGYATHLAKGKRISIYDGRFSLPSGEQGDAFGADDPVSNKVLPKLAACYQGYLRPLLQIPGEAEYVIQDSSIVKHWDFSTPRPVASIQESLMRNDENLRILYCAGYYDILTPVGYLRYLLSQFDFPEDRITVRYYPSGHMPYLGRDTARQLGGDIRDFIR